MPLPFYTPRKQASEGGMSSEIQGDSLNPENGGRRAKETLCVVGIEGKFQGGKKWRETQEFLHFRSTSATILIANEGR